MVDQVGAAYTMPGGVFAEPILRFTLAAETLLVGVLGVVSMFTGEGPQATVGTAIACVISASTVPVAIIVGRKRFADEWWKRTSPLNNAFVLYADISVAAVLLTFADAELATVGASLFVLVGACAAHFAHPRVFWFHLACSNAVVIVLMVRGFADGIRDPVAVAFGSVVVALVMNGSAALLSTILASSRRRLSDAVTDPLTGLLNRRGIEAHAASEIERGARPRSLVLVDLDDFKSVNDTHGHAAGDVALRLVADRLTTAAGTGAVVSRFGGEEFVVLVADPRPDLFAYAERLRVNLTDPRDAIPITASAGASPPATDDGDLAGTFTRTLAAADAAMYRAKKNGRDRTELA